MYVNNYMHQNSFIFSNSFMPTPIDEVANDDPVAERIDLTNVRDFSSLNNTYTMNYSSNFMANEAKAIDQSITEQAFRDSERFEDPFKIARYDIIDMNNYKKPLSNTLPVLLAQETSKQGESESVTNVYGETVVVRSLFNPYLAVNVKGMMENLPITNSPSSDDDATVTAYINGGKENASRYRNYLDFDTSDCSIRKLVELSNTKVNGENHSVLGRALYKYADFMFCKDLGKVSNNYMITLRKFPAPIGDNIFSLVGTEPDNGSRDRLNVPPDIGRMVCWLGEDNKLEDILKYTFNESFQQKESDFYENESEEDSSQRGMIGSIVNLMNPEYRKGVAEGKWGSGNMILEKLAGNTAKGGSSLLSNVGTYESGQAADVLRGKMYDKNKIYYKPGIIRDTHLYEGRLSFTNNFTLTFNYELRAYDNINPKTAFLDLIGNILRVTYRNGSFWGGENKIWGPPGNQAGWNQALGLVGQGTEAAKNFANSFIQGVANGQPVLGKLAKKIESFGSAGLNLNFNIDDISGNLQNFAKKISSNDVEEFTNMLSGMFLNQFGRPAVYALTSILTGDPVGLWHVTIGNPRNPIASMGNMIVENTTIQQYGPLGIDDFPTGIKVVVNLKHARSRDASEIENMYTKGINATHITPKYSDYKSLYDSSKAFGIFGTEDETMIEVGYSN